MKRKITLLFAIVLFLNACVAPSNIYHSSSSLSVPMNTSVLIVPPDVVISLLNAGGNKEPRADWSENVQSSLEDAIQGYLYSKGVRFISYGQKTIADEHIDIMRQANVLMDAVELSQVRQGIGERIYAIDKSTLEKLTPFRAEYALVTVLRAELASGGRTAVAILSSIAGVAVKTNSAEFRVALFDLRDGQLKWANFDKAALAEVGNLVKANESGWEKAIAHILVGIPL